jgi:SH3 domain protein
MKNAMKNAIKNAMKIVLCFVVALSGFIASASAQADTVYIRDIIYVPLRGGQSNEYRILHQGIRSGTVLERLEENDETGFSRVITPDGLEGWIQSQYLVTEPIARDRLANLQSQLETLQTDYQAALDNLEIESEAAKTAAIEIQRLDAQRVELNTELSRITELAANVIQIDQQNDSLLTDVNELNQQIDDLVVMNANLKDTATQTWFMIGGGTVFFGLLLGFVISRQLHARRDSGWS